MSFVDLPHEIITVVIQIALDTSAVPSNILCVCWHFCDVGTDHLYTHLRFTSPHQLHQFVLSDAPHPRTITPRTLAVDLAGNAQHGVLCDLCDALVKCQQLAKVADPHGTAAQDVGLKRLRLRMHSYSRDSAVDVLARGLQAISPDTFEWTGPDPDHHFSTAIVPLVASTLFEQFSSWRHVRGIMVTNIRFTATASNSNGGHFPLMGDIPSLHSLYIGQATFLRAEAVAGMFCQGRMGQLGVVKLVDAYSESIWGPRLRRSDIERAARMLCCKGGGGGGNSTRQKDCDVREENREDHGR